MSRSLPDNQPLSRDEEAADWCVRFADSPMSAEEVREFDIWIAEAPNARAFEDAIMIWQSAEAFAEKPEFLHIRREALENYRRANSRRWSRPFFGHWRALTAIAATILLLLLAGWLEMRDPMQLYETGVGERRVAILDDGSRLSLDADTRVEVRMRDNRRELRLLSGRAKFDVAKEPLRPFSVLAGNKMVVATGTSFSVELLTRQVHVLLYEGHVAVLEASKPPAGEVRGASVAADHVRLSGTTEVAGQSLTPGRELIASLANQDTSIVTTDLPRSLSWESGQLSFEDEALPSAVERMNRYARQKLVIADQATAHLRVNGVFTAGDTDAFVEGLRALYPVEVTRTDTQLTLKRN
jgi:transmembrane sensor